LLRSNLFYILLLRQGYTKVLDALHCCYCGLICSPKKKMEVSRIKIAINIYNLFFPTRINLPEGKSIPSIHTPPLQKHNRSNLFIAAGEGAFPNCQIYGRTYCTEVEGYPE